VFPLIEAGVRVKTGNGAQVSNLNPPPRARLCTVSGHQAIASAVHGGPLSFVGGRHQSSPGQLPEQVIKIPTGPCLNLSHLLRFLAVFTTTDSTWSSVIRRGAPGGVRREDRPDLARHSASAIADGLRGDSQRGRDGAVGKTIGTAPDNVSAASEPVARLGTLAPTKELGAVFFGDESEALGRPRCMA
jgi:hypothetical protein